MLDNRELAIGIWLAVGLLWACRNKDVRPRMLNVLRAFLAWRMVVMWGAMALYIALAATALKSIQLWDESHLKHTFLWTVTVAIVQVVQVAPKDMATFRQACLQNFSITVVFDFVVNLHAFSLLVELMLTPLLFFLAAAWAVSQTKEEYKPVEKIFSNALAIIGVCALLYSAYQIYADWSTFARIETAKDFLVPLALSLLFLPFIYFTMLYMTYERHLARLRFYVPDPKVRRLFKWRSILSSHISVTKLETIHKRLRGNQINSRTDVRAFFGRASALEAVAPEGYRSMKWGHPPSNGLVLFSSTSTDNLTLYKPSEYLPFLGLPIAEELFGFCNGKLYQGTVWVDGLDRAQEARVRISALFGVPSLANERMGLWKWTWPNTSVEIRLWFEADRDQASILFSNNAIE